MDLNNYLKQNYQFSDEVIDKLLSDDYFLFHLIKSKKKSEIKKIIESFSYNRLDRYIFTFFYKKYAKSFGKNLKNNSNENNVGVLLHKNAYASMEKELLFILNKSFKIKKIDQNLLFKIKSIRKKAYDSVRYKFSRRNNTKRKS